MKSILLLFLAALSGWLVPVEGNAHGYSDTSKILHVAPYQHTAVCSFKWIDHAEPENNTDALIESQLLGHAKSRLTIRMDRKTLFHFLESDKLKKASLDKKLAYRLYGKLAKVLLRMKMYPLAMQYYFKTAVLFEDSDDPHPTGRDSNDERSGSVSLMGSDITSFTNKIENALPGSLALLRQQDSSFQKPDLRKKLNNNSVAVSNNDLTACFADGKPAVAYAVIIHVKQPVSGKRQSFTGINNVGHMFITLMKYNADSGAVSRSFGFYPHKDYFFSATPLRPAASSVFKNDALHDWDESIGKFISEKRFKKIIRLISHYENRSYHLNENNCTDFGLYAAEIAGIIIDQANGTWPLGSGNNPANAGQSILEGKFRNADTQNTSALFVCTEENK